MAMKWLRKNSKKILVWVSVPIMVIFLLPFTSGRGGNGNKDQDFAQLQYPDGEAMTLQMSDIGLSERQLRALEEIGVGRMSQAGFFAQTPDLGGIGVVPAMLGHVLVFGDLSTLAQMRPMLYQMAMNWSTDDADFKRITADLEAIVNADPTGSRVLFVLLAEEARRAGIHASEAQIDSVMSVCRKAAAQLGNPELGRILNSYGLTRTEFRAGLGDLISILLYADMVTDAGVISENEIRQSVRKGLDNDQVAGSYVSFRDSFYRDKTGEPADQDMQPLFDAYKGMKADQAVSEAEAGKNPFGFGYKLENRVQLDILSFDILAAETLARTEFEAKPFVQQEDQLQTYWSENKQNYPVRTQSETETAPRYQSFDEAIDQVKRDYLRQQAVERVMRIVADASQRIQAAAVKPADYPAVAQAVSTDTLAVEYARTPFLSYRKATEYDQSRLSRARVVRASGQGPSALGMLFNCEPLRDRPAGRLDEPPLALMEELGSVQALDYSNHPEKAYIIRVVAVDKEREPVSLLDDGRQGGADVAPLTDGVNDLKEAITGDWKRMKAFEMAASQAEGFAAAAATDWDGALKQYNGALKTDPNDTWDRLRLEELQRERDMMDRYRDMMQQNQQASSYYGQALNRIRRLLDNSAKAWHENQARPAATLPVYKDYEESACLVFKDLTIAPANTDQYLKNKTATAHQLLNDKQGRLALIHFNPENIKRRCGFVDARPFASEEESGESGGETPAPASPAADPS